MPAFNPEQWPVILTNTDWQKKKGNIAKTAGKSGIGEAMTAAEKAYKKIDFKKFDAREVLPQDRDVDKLQKFKAGLGAYHKSAVEPARLPLKQLRDAAQKTATEWKKNKLIPASSTKHAEEVAKTADLLYMTLAGNSQFFGDQLKTFDKMIAVKQKMETDELQKIDVTVANLEEALKDVAKDPTVKTWSEGNTSAHQRCRSMCNSIRNIPKLKAKYWSTWQPFGNDFHRDCPTGDPEQEKAVMTLKLKTVAKALLEFKRDFRRDLAA